MNIYTKHIPKIYQTSTKHMPRNIPKKNTQKYTKTIYQKYNKHIQKQIRKLYINLCVYKNNVYIYISLSIYIYI